MPTRTLSELASLCGAVLDGDGTRIVEGLASLREATAREISFYANPRYRTDLETTRAAAVVVGTEVQSPRADLVLLRCKDPNRAFTAIIEAFFEAEPEPLAGVHPSAVVDREARVSDSASIGPLCWIGPGAAVGDRAFLHAGVTLGRGASVGEDSVLHDGVRVYSRVSIGARCILHSGTVLGSDGFGYEPTREGWAKIPQRGTVVVEDDVEIGANCTVARGRFGATRISRGAKLDNLVHLAHNVIIGEAALVIAQVGVAGSTHIGKRAIIAGQAGIAGHVTIGDGARLGAQSGVSVDIPAGQDWMGSPAHPRGETLRSWTLLPRLPEINQRVRELEKKLARLEQALGRDRTEQTGVEHSGEGSP